MHLLRRGWEDAQKSLQEAQKGFQERLQEDNSARRQGRTKNDVADNDHKPLDTLMKGFEDLRTTLQPLAGSKLGGLRSTFQNTAKRPSGHSSKAGLGEEVPFEEAWAAYCARNPRLRDPKVLKSLVRRGVPDDRRAELWRHCLGVEAEAAKSLAVAALEAANRLPSGLDSGGQTTIAPARSENNNDNAFFTEDPEAPEASSVTATESEGGVLLPSGDSAADVDGGLVEAEAETEASSVDRAGDWAGEENEEKVEKEENKASPSSSSSSSLKDVANPDSSNPNLAAESTQEAEANLEGRGVGGKETRDENDDSGHPKSGEEADGCHNTETQEDRRAEDKVEENEETEETAVEERVEESESELQSKSSSSFREPERERNPNATLDLVGGVGRVAKGVNEQIEVDVLRTLPYDSDFQEMGGPNMLRRVLRSLAVLDLELGYCQSMNFLAATFLLVFRDETLALHAVKQLLTKLNTRCWYTDGMLQLRGDTIVLEGLIKERLPQVDAMLRRHRFDLLFLTSKWFMCLFSTVLQGETLKRVWDTMLSDGIETVFRVSLAMLHLGSEQIVRTSTHDDLIFLFQGWDLQVEPKVLISAAYDPQVVGTLSRSELSQRRKVAATKVTAVDARDILRSSRASRGGRRRG
mmetsp:Transcript_48769/g.105051  ORF Transcript_48769/g.105051 Transcript_48769/m.105051 type:complete len:639 (-) Transcript_48769:42-1958(-)